MRKVFALVGTLALPAAITSLVCAVPQNNINLADKVISIGPHSNYTVRFRNDRSAWPPYAEIYKMTIADEDVIPRLEIPASVKADDGKEYNVYSLNLHGADHCKGTGTIQLLDFSNAYWLREIGKGCFAPFYTSAYHENCNFKVQSINWSGAESLTLIKECAFEAQYFDSNISPNTFNLLNTSIEKIENEAFARCCVNTGRNFDDIILPPTLKRLDDHAFKSSIEQDRFALFKHIIFVNDKPSTLSIGDDWGMPQLQSVADAQIVVPCKTLDGYKKIKHLVPSNKIHESSIYYDDDHMGRTHICAHAELAGVDDDPNLSWYPRGSDGRIFEPQTIKVYGGPREDFLTVGKDQKMHWKAGCPVGQYRFFVVAWAYDSNGLINVAISPKCRFTSVLGKIADLPSFFQGIKQEEGYSDYFHMEIKGPSESMVTDTMFDLIGVPAALQGKVSVECSMKRDKGWLRWSSGIEAGTYDMVIRPSCRTSEGDNRFYFPSQPIRLVITDKEIKGLGIKLWVGDGTTTEEYNGQMLHLKQNQDYYIYVQNDSKIEVKDPIISCDKAATYEEKTAEYGYKYKFNTADLGSYRFCFEEKQKTTTTSDFTSMFSNWIDVKVGNETPTIDANNDYVVTEIDTQQGKQFNIPLTASPDVKVTGTPTVVAEEWMDTTSKGLVTNYITVEPSSSDPKAINLKVAKGYFSSIASTSVCDLMITSAFENTETNETYQCQKTLSLVITNSGSIRHRGDSILYVFEEEEKTFDEPFEYLLNNKGVSELEGLSFYAQVDGDITGKYLDKVTLVKESGANRVRLQVKNITFSKYDDEIALPVTIYAKYTDPVTQLKLDAQTSVTVMVHNEFKFTSVPDDIYAMTGIAGKASKPLKTMFNGEDGQDWGASYSITGYPDESLLFIDEDGYINWTDQVVPGQYQLTIEAKIWNKSGQKRFTITTPVSFFVTAQPVPPPEPTPSKGPNIGAIVGGAVGGAIVVGGVSAGTAIGVKKHKAKLIKK